MEDLVDEVFGLAGDVHPVWELDLVVDYAREFEL